jgi:hypothetical protein
MTFCTELEELKRSDRLVVLDAIASKKFGHSKKGLGAEISLAKKFRSKNVEHLIGNHKQFV